MSLVPKTLSRLAHRSILKLSKNGPTLMIIGGVVGLGATAVLAAKAGTKTPDVVADHNERRAEADKAFDDKRDHQQAMLKVYTKTVMDFTQLYGPAIVLGVASGASVLGGHKILKGRHIATMVAYSGLQDKFTSYRGRVAETLGADREKEIHDGAHGKWVEDEDRPGEYNLKSLWSEDNRASNYLSPFFDEYCSNWTKSPSQNYSFLMGVQQHSNHLLQARGHLFLNEVLDALRLPRTPEGAVMGWVLDGKNGDGYVDFGFLTSNNPTVVAFRNEVEPSVRLNFNVDDKPIWDRI